MRRALAALALLTACSLEGPLPHYHTVCPTEEARERTEAAVAEWEAATGRELLEVLAHEAPGCLPVDVVDAIPGRAATRGQVWHDGERYRMTIERDAVHAIWLHELGHVLGLGHVPQVWEDGGRESVMNAATLPWQAITDEDGEMVR